MRNEEVDNEVLGNIVSTVPSLSMLENPPLTENVPEVSTPNAPSHANVLDSSTGYVLPFRHNREKPPNRYSPDEEEKNSKYPIANRYS